MFSEDGPEKIEFSRARSFATVLRITQLPDVVVINAHFGQSGP